MTTEKSTLARVGAWGQIVVLALGGVFWYFGIPIFILASCVGYLVVTTIGVVGIARTESAIAGPIAFPLLVPGFVPFFYFVTQHA